MNIGIIADVHGNYNALKLVIDDMKKNKIDLVIVLGDIIFWGNEPQKCFDTIKELKPIVWIKGNTDNWFNEIDENFQPKDEKEDKLYKEFIKVNKVISMDISQTMKVLKEKEEIEIEGKKILCVHGSDRKINEPIGIMTPQKEMYELINRLEHDILLCSHTHSPYVVASKGKLIINVGSVGLPNDEPKASYGILRFDGDNFEYGIRRIKINHSYNL
jgi:putative phosphoesterase